MGWQSGANAVGPIMALLSCQLPKDASLSSNSPSPCMPQGKAWSFYRLTVCIGRPGDTCKINYAAGALLKSVGRYQIQSAAEAFRALLRTRAMKDATSADVCKGSGFMAMGSPFGALAPSHFVNHTAAGSISNALQLPVRPLLASYGQSLSHSVYTAEQILQRWPPLRVLLAIHLHSQSHSQTHVSEHAQPHQSIEPAVFLQGSSAPGLLLADMHCLPGMEGGPVLSSSGKLIGILSLPLSSPSFSAEA